MLLRTRTSVPLLALLCLAAFLAAGTVRAAGGEVTISGHLLDAAGQPVAGNRVVFRAAGEASIYITPPTDESGLYTISLPAGREFVPFSVLLPSGGRIELRDAPSFAAAAGVVHDIRLPTTAGERGRGAGSTVEHERLFLAFAEDAAIADWILADGELEYADASDSSEILARITGAFQPKAIPSMEFGGSVGIGSGEVPGVGRESGTTDLDVWAKFAIPGGGGRWPRVAVGGLITAPTGSADAGLSYDGLRSKLFCAARFDLPRGQIAAHIGVRVNGNGEAGGVDLDGKTAAAAGVGLLMPLGAEVSLVVEAGYEGKRFEGFDPDARLLVGVNWRPFLEGTLRAAIAGGLADGAPDTQVLVGYEFDF